MITIATDKIYLVTDASNGVIHLVYPKDTTPVIVHLIADCPDPYGPNKNDKAIFDLLRADPTMVTENFDI